MRHKDLLIKCLCLAVFALCIVCYAEEMPTPLYEQKIKAGLVYNLLKYTEWPKTSPNQLKNIENPNTLKICLFGDDPFNGYLSPLHGRTAQQATIAIAHVASVPDTESCKVIVIHRNQQHQLQTLLAFLQGKNILTISDIENFAELGGMVELTRQQEKIALQINKNSIDGAKLSVDARMLKLAKIVTKKGGA